MKKPTSFSSQGEIKKAQHKRFSETVLVVPFFGGKKKNLQRHSDFLNEIGFDCVVFELNDEWKSLATSFLSSDALFGLKHVWANQIESLLNEIPGQKIVYSFSNPSGSAIEAIARRHATDVKGLVCDGGPSAQLWHSFVNYFTHEIPLPSYPVKAFAAAATVLLWHPKFKDVVFDDLVEFPKGFRILSVRGWKDPLITPKMIDLVFDPHTHLDWQKLSLPEGKHLNGLKDFPDLYKPSIAKFLEEIATPLK